MRREEYLVAVNLVPEFRGTRTECERFLKALKRADLSNPYYMPGWNSYYCGKFSNFRVGIQTR